MPGFPGAFGVAKDSDGSVDPSSQLFRANFIGVETGPMISQVRNAVDSTSSGNGTASLLVEVKACYIRCVFCTSDGTKLAPSRRPLFLCLAVRGDAWFLSDFERRQMFKFELETPRPSAFRVDSL